MKYRASVGDRSFEIEIDHERLVRVNGQPLYVELEQVGGLPVYSLSLDDTGYVVCVEEGRDEYRVEVRGQVHPIVVELQRPRLAPKESDCREINECAVISAPLAGHLLSLPVKAGDEVERGQVLAVVESMKMQMGLRAPHSGVVETVHGPPARPVERGETLVVLQAQRESE
jgi:biotin carboxyl carrier protein